MRNVVLPSILLFQGLIQGVFLNENRNQWPMFEFHHILINWLFQSLFTSNILKSKIKKTTVITCTQGKNKNYTDLRRMSVSWLTLSFFFFFKNKNKQTKELGADNIRATNSDITTPMMCRYVNKGCEKYKTKQQQENKGCETETCTCCCQYWHLVPWKKEGVKLINTYPETHSFDSA